MRLDKYLVNTRIVKRRVVASTLIQEGSITLSGKKVKPSYEVKINDVLKICLGRHNLEIKVLQIKEIRNKEESKELFEILKDEVN